MKTDLIYPRKRNAYDWTIEVLSLIFLVASIYPILYNDLDHKSKIPIHYNYLGEADSWISSSYLWILAIIPLFLFIGITFSERFYKKFNYGFKLNINETYINHVYRIGVRFVRLIKLYVIAFFAYMNNNIVGTFNNENMNLNPITNFIFMGLMIISSCITMFLIHKAIKNKS